MEITLLLLYILSILSRNSKGRKGTYGHRNRGHGHRKKNQNFISKPSVNKSVESIQSPKYEKPAIVNEAENNSNSEKKTMDDNKEDVQVEKEDDNSSNILAKIPQFFNNVAEKLNIFSSKTSPKKEDEVKKEEKNEEKKDDNKDGQEEKNEKKEEKKGRKMNFKLFTSLYDFFSNIIKKIVEKSKQDQNFFSVMYIFGMATFLCVMFFLVVIIGIYFLAIFTVFPVIVLIAVACLIRAFGRGIMSCC